jgi:hypothetical protein
MEVAGDLESTLAQLTATGLAVEVHEDGEWIGSLADLNCEVRREATGTLIHLWSGERNLVRRVLRVAERAEGRLRIEVQRFGRAKPGSLEFLTSVRARPARRVSRSQFVTRLRRLLTQQFPDEEIDSLTSSADIGRSFSGCYTRGMMHRGNRAWAVMAASSAENAATLDGILTYALVWLDWAHAHAGKRSVAGLRLFLPEGASRITAHRSNALDPALAIELYEVEETLWRARRIDPRDAGNLATSLTARHDLDFILAEAKSAIDPILALAPEVVSAAVPPGTRDVSLRFRGLEFARWSDRKIFFGLAEPRRELATRNQSSLRKLVRELADHRRPDAPDARHALYRAQGERWLESLVEADPTRIEPRLDPRFLYSQVPAFSAGDRGVIDLLGVTRQGRLAVIELKAAEDIHLPLQAVDYWLRVRWHAKQENFQRYGYFPGIELQAKPPLLYLVAPGFLFHSTTDAILRYLSPEIEITRVGLNEDWRRGLQVVLRQGR